MPINAILFTGSKKDSKALGHGTLPKGHRSGNKAKQDKMLEKFLQLEVPSGSDTERKLVADGWKVGLEDGAKSEGVVIDNGYWVLVNFLN